MPQTQTYFITRNGRLNEHQSRVESTYLADLIKLNVKIIVWNKTPINSTWLYPELEQQISSLKSPLNFEMADETTTNDKMTISSVANLSPVFLISTVAALIELKLK